MDIHVRSKFWLVDGEGRPVFGQGKEKLLLKIDELGSIRAAALDLKMSYRAAWGKIRSTQERLGVRLIETVAGGGPDRGAKLTDEAWRLLRTFQELQTRGHQQADALFWELFGHGT